MDRWDVMALLGTVLLGCGLWLIAPWLALTATGGDGTAERAAARQALIDAKKGGA